MILRIGRAIVWLHRQSCWYYSSCSVRSLDWTPQPWPRNGKSGAISQQRLDTPKGNPNGIPTET